MDVILYLLLIKRSERFMLEDLPKTVGSLKEGGSCQRMKGSQAAINDTLDSREVSTMRASVEFISRPGRYLPSREDIEKRCFAASTVTSGGKPISI